MAIMAGNSIIKGEEKNPKNGAASPIAAGFGRFCLLFLLFGAVLALASCSPHKQAVDEPLPPYLSYENKAYGFSIDYPTSWNTSAPKLEDKWAVTDSRQNAILFIAGKLPEGASLQQLAFDSMRQEMDPEPVDEEQLRQVIRYMEAGNITWYTFAVEYKDRGLESIISGTICPRTRSHINIIMVSKKDDFNVLKDEYTNLLQTFRCIG